ncbi:hypothetical protein C0995_006879, partial [Termitomyces sp. Mi166
MTFKARDAQLAASFSLKSRSAPTIKEVIEDCLESPNPESIHQPILVDLKGGESEGAQAYQLHVSPSLLKEHLWADANVATPETKLEEQILHEVVPSKYYEGYHLQLTVFLCNIPSHVAHKVTHDLQSLQEYLQTEIATVNNV